MASNVSTSERSRLELLFKSMDKDFDNYLNPADLSAAFERRGSKPSMAEIQALIREIDSDGDGKVSFDEFLYMNDLVTSGKLPETAHLWSLIKDSHEYLIANANRTLEKNVPTVKVIQKGQVAQAGQAGLSSYLEEAPQGEKFKVGLKKPQIKRVEIKEVKKIHYENLPPKKSLADLP